METSLYRYLIIPDTQRAQQHLYMGVRVGTSAKYPFKQKIKFFHRSWVQCVPGESTPLPPLTDFVFPLPWLWCPISFGTLHVLELPRHSVPSSERWEGQMVRSLTSCCVVKIPALRMNEFLLSSYPSKRPKRLVPFYVLYPRQAQHFIH